MLVQFPFDVLQEHAVRTTAVAAAAEPNAQLSQSPFPHCKLASLQRGMSAAASVEAVQQGSEDDDVQGEFASKQAGGITSLPSTSSSRRPKPRSLHGILPVGPTLQQRSPGSCRKPGLEQGHSVVYDNNHAHSTQSPASQHISGLSPAQQIHKQARSASGNAELAEQAESGLMLSPECSGASQGHLQDTSQHEMCQMAPEPTQQATIQEVHHLHFLHALYLIDPEFLHIATLAAIIDHTGVFALTVVEKPVAMQTQDSL